MTVLCILVASFMLWSLPGAIAQQPGIVAGAILAQAADSAMTIMDGEQALVHWLPFVVL